jgi:hypothetical protein
MNTSTLFEPYTHDLSFRRPVASDIDDSYATQRDIASLAEQYPKRDSSSVSCQFARTTLEKSQIAFQEQRYTDAAIYLLACLERTIQLRSFVEDGMFPEESEVSEKEYYLEWAKFIKDAMPFTEQVIGQLMTDKNEHDLPIAESLALHVLNIFPGDDVDNHSRVRLIPTAKLGIKAKWLTILAQVKRRMAEALERKAKEKHRMAVEINCSRKAFAKITESIWTELFAQIDTNSSQSEVEPQPIRIQKSVVVSSNKQTNKPQLLHITMDCRAELQKGESSYFVLVSQDRLARYFWNNCSRQIQAPGSESKELAPRRSHVSIWTIKRNGKKYSLLDVRINIWSALEGDLGIPQNDWVDDWVDEEKKEANKPMVISLVEQSIDAAISALPKNSDGEIQVSIRQEVHVVVTDNKQRPFMPPSLFNLVRSTFDHDTNRTTFVYQTWYYGMGRDSGELLLYGDNFDNDGNVIESNVARRIRAVLNPRIGPIAHY